MSIESVYKKTIFQQPSCDGLNEIYCEKKERIIKPLDQTFMQHECIECPFFAGMFQGHGIECQYYEPMVQGETFVTVDARDMYNWSLLRRAKKGKEEYKKAQARGEV